AGERRSCHRRRWGGRLRESGEGHRPEAWATACVSQARGLCYGMCVTGQRPVLRVTTMVDARGGDRHIVLRIATGVADPVGAADCEPPVGARSRGADGGGVG